MYKPTEDELTANRENNVKVRRGSMAKDRSGLKGLKDKAMDALTGNKEQS